MAFLTPDVVTREKTINTITVAFPIPCGSAPEADIPSSGPRLVPSVNCADPRIKFTLEGFDLSPELRDRSSAGGSRTAARSMAVRPIPMPRSFHRPDVEARPIAVSQWTGWPAQLEVETLTPVGRTESPARPLRMCSRPCS